MDVGRKQHLDIARSSLRGRVQYAFGALRRSPVGVIGGIIVTLVLLCAISGPMIAPHDAAAHNLRARFKPPGFADDSGSYPLGTDQLGRDILSRVIMGSRVSVTVGIAAVAIAGTIGLLYGILAGFLGGWLDALLMRIADALLAIPFIILAVAVSGVVGPSLFTLILILGFTGWVTYARVARSEVLVVRELDYVTAARVVGQPANKIMVKHILPNVLASAIVLAALQVGITILAESSLSFLGLGVQPPTVTWGLMLADGRQHLGSAWWMATFPGIAITITVLGVVFLGDWLRDVLDPRLRE
ncbi:ABC transporter permease [Chloroflexi bacterium TSY]|nr:ABC transporter permease [Chloroflexi bacterium TSY]